MNRCFLPLVCAFASVLLSSCGTQSETALTPDPHLATNGSVEVSAKLVEVPEGAIFKRDLYNYTTILKYQVLRVHRGDVNGETIYVGHYNPWKPRNEVADKRVQGIGGNLKRFEAGQVHHLANFAQILQVSLKESFVGQDTDTGGPGLFISSGDGARIEVSADQSFGRTRLFDLGNQLDPARGGQRGEEITYLRRVGQSLSELFLG